jgi:hypothetical protein
VTTNATKTHIEHDAATDAAWFLRTLFGDTVGPERRLSIFMMPGARAARFASIEEAVAHAERQMVSSDVYFGVGLIRGNPAGRGTVIDVCGICGFWADIDLAAPWRADKPLPKTVDEAMTIVDAMPLAPSLIVESGHGLHAYWLFKEPWVFKSEAERLEAASMARGWHGLVCEAAAKSKWRLENLGELARVLRLPGTLNHKGQEPVLVRIRESYPDRRYNPEDFETYAQAESAASVQVAEVSLSPSAQPPMKKLVEACASSPKFLATWNRTRTDLSDQSQSGYDLALASIAARMGWGDQEIADLILAHRARHGESPEKALRGDYIRRTLLKAREGMLAGDEQIHIESSETMTPTTHDAKAAGAWGDIKALDGHEDPPQIDLGACFAPVPELQDYIAAVAECHQVDPVMPAMLALSCLSLAISRSVEVGLAPDWDQPAPVWTCVVADPGERKSRVYAELTAPIFEFQKERDEQLHRGLARQAAETRSLQKRIETLRTRDARSGREFEHHVLLGLEEELACREEFQKPRLILMDATPESVIIGLYRNGEKLGIIAAESSALENSLGRYSDTPNLDIYLQAHEGDPYSYVRRKGDDVLLERPALVMSFSIQPHAAKGLLDNEAAIGRGLSARFLYARPRSLKGHRKLSTQAVPEELRAWWEARMLQLLSLPYPGEVCIIAGEAARRECEPHKVTLDEDAAATFLQFRAAIERELSQEDGELAGTHGWAEKLAGAVGRIALSLQMAKCPGAPRITLDVVQAAIAWSEFLIPAFQNVVATMSVDPLQEQARRIIGWVKRERVSSFTQREAHRRHRCKAFKSADDWQPVLEYLVQRNYLRPTVVPAPGKRGGRPSAGYEVNPSLLTAGVGE